MRPTAQFLIFFLIFFGVTLSISFYIYLRGLQSIPATSTLRHAYTIVFWIVAVSFMAGRFSESVLPSFIADVLVWMGSFWIAGMLYFLIAVVSLDLLRAVNHFIPFFPSVITTDYPRAKYITAVIVMAAVGLLLLGGHVNSILPRVRRLNITIPRKSAKLQKLDIAMVSDVHLGTIVGRSRLDHIVEQINSLDPDLVLLPGDIVDEDLTPVIEQNLGEALRNIKSRFGVYASTGNHEYLGRHVDRACAYLVEHNISMLRDQSIKLGDSFFLVGREDRLSASFTGHPRKLLRELMAAVDKNYPVVLMDHQPFGLQEAVNEGVDLQLSGHTHYGQLWPVNYIVKKVYELPWGYKKIGATHFYVSDGVGTWGPPVRIGNRPEIVHITVNFEQEEASKRK
jgi:predicted MPP superfamily phosphohydrolase